MANLVKTKRSIFVISVIITTALWVSESTWVHPLIIKKWDQQNPLTWDDFIGKSPITSTYDAAISSKVYIEPDSTGSYEIYAGQNNRLSWTKYYAEADELLRHEQYHFNITELHARMLEELALSDSGNMEQFDISQSLIARKLDRMQNQYDDESEHGVNFAYQNIWEYQVDSMLSSYQSNRGFYSDHYGGTKVWFPTKPQHYAERGDRFLSDCYTLLYYGVDLTYCVFYDADYGEMSFLEDWKQYLETDSFKVQQLTHLHAPQYEQLEVVHDDTIFQWHYHQKVYAMPPYEFRMSTIVPLNDPDSLIYFRMKNAFLNHFSFEPQEDFWLNVGNDKNPIVYEHDLYRREVKDSTHSYNLGQLPFSDYSVLYHLPITAKDQLMIPFKIVRHPMEDVAEVLYIINDERSYSQSADSVTQFVKIDLNLLKEGSNKIQFGYTAYSDSTAKGFHFYSSIVEYENHR